MWNSLRYDANMAAAYPFPLPPNLSPADLFNLSRAPPPPPMSFQQLLDPSNDPQIDQSY
jgi:hypothetical protein